MTDLIQVNFEMYLNIFVMNDMLSNMTAWILGKQWPFKTESFLFYHKVEAFQLMPAISGAILINVLLDSTINPMIILNISFVVRLNNHLRDRSTSYSGKVD